LITARYYLVRDDGEIHDAVFSSSIESGIYERVSAGARPRRNREEKLK